MVPIGLTNAEDAITADAGSSSTDRRSPNRMERAAFADEPTWLRYRIERLREIRSLVNDERASDAIDELIAEAEIRLEYLASMTEKPKPIPEPQRDSDVTDEESSRRMERGLRRLLNMPPQPRGKLSKDGSVPNRRRTKSTKPK